jgi:hypothetical protein
MWDNYGIDSDLNHIKFSAGEVLLEVTTQCYLWPGEEWPHKEVGFFPRGPSSLGASKAIGAYDDPFFCQHFFGGPLKNNSFQDLVSQSAPVMPNKFFLNSLEIF